MLSKILRILGLFKWAFGQYRLLMSFLVISSFASGVLEGIGTSAIIPLFALIGGGAGNGGDSGITRVIKTFFGYLHLPLTLKFLLLFMVFIFLLKAVVAFLVSYINVYIIANYENKTRRELFSLTFRARWPFLSKQKLGFLEQVLTTDTSYGSNLLLHLGNIIPAIISILVFSVLAVSVSWLLAISTLVVGGIIFFLFKPAFYGNRKYSQELGNTYKEASHFINENILGLKTIKALHAEGAIEKKASGYFERMKVLFTKIMIMRGVIGVSMQPIGLLYIFAIFALFYKFYTFNLGYFAVLVYAINRIFNQIQILQGLMHCVVTEEPYLESINRYRAATLSNIEVEGGKKKFNFEKEILFKNISFSYGDDKILAGIDFNIKKGEMVGLIGPSGSGKTTLVDLFLCLYRPQDGEILIDGVNIFEINIKEWRTNIGYVSQDAFLINDTIENNIKFYNADLNFEELVDAARQADIYDFIQTLSQKFQTVIGERGTTLSGGQRQRIVLARILARKPQVLILDEATSSLDNESELQIQKVIEGLKGRITVLAIAHRLTTIINCDRLLVLENGKIIEQGVPRELLKNRDSYFFKVYNIRNHAM